MSADSEPNYPDVLGYITGGPRVRIGVLQLAVAVHPRITRAGRPFEVMVLIQNASDVELEVVVSLTFPERDAKKQKNRFVSKAARLVIGLEAAEVGVAVLPVSSLPDTAPSDSYSITMDVKVRPSGSEKPNRIREANGGGALDLDDLEAAAQAKLPELRNVQWDTRSSLIGSSLSVPFTVMSGKVGQFADLKPSWTRLWSLSDLVDQVLLFNKHKESLAKMLPKLTRAPVYTQLVESTRRQFSESGVVLKPLEEQLIAKILTVILEYARLSPKDIRYLVGEDYSIQRYLEVDELRPAPKSVALPAWAQDLLRALNRDERVVEYPVRAIGHFSYAGLLKDAMQHTFDRIQAITDLDMASKPGNLGALH